MTEQDCSYTSTSPFVELLELLQLYISTLDDQIEAEEKTTRMNGVIHECDRLLKLAASVEVPVKEGDAEEIDTETAIDEVAVNAAQVTKSAVFHSIYGQALRHFFYDTFESYLSFFESILFKYATFFSTFNLEDLSEEDQRSIDDLKPTLLQDLNVKAALERNLSEIIALAGSHMKKALQYINNPLLEGSQDVSSEDLQVYESFASSVTIQVEFEHTFLIKLIFLKSRFFHTVEAALNDPFEQIHISLAAKLEQKFNVYFSDKKLLLPVTDSSISDYSEMLSEEINAILDWVSDLTYFSKQWNYFLHLFLIQPKTITDIYSKDDIPFDGNLSIIEEHDELPDAINLPLSVPHIDGHVPYYTNITRLIEKVLL